MSKNQLTPKNAAPPQPDLSRRNALAAYKQFRKLAGQRICMSEAERIYGIPQQTISRWVARSLIKILGRNPQDQREIFLDAQDMAYCAYVYDQLGGKQGNRVFNPDGTPWHPKRALPKDSAARKRIRQMALAAALEGRPFDPHRAEGTNSLICQQQSEPVAAASAF